MKTELGPDATGLGLDLSVRTGGQSGKHSLGGAALLPGLVPEVLPEGGAGVAEVASVGGFTQQYQVNVDPNRLRSYGIPISRVADAVRSGQQSKPAHACWSSAARST